MPDTPMIPTILSEEETRTLRSCPFCGGKKILVNRDFDNEADWIVQCDNKADACPMVIHVIDAFTREAAIAAWNRRSVPEGAGETLDTPWPPRDVVERLVLATGHLLIEHDCDHHGYEETCAALDVAKAWLHSASRSSVEPGLSEAQRRTATELLECARGWDADARLLGNIRADRVVALMESLLAARSSSGTPDTLSPDVCGKVDYDVTCDRKAGHDGDHCGSTPNMGTRIW
jgi:hypothetical protein